MSNKNEFKKLLNEVVSLGKEMFGIDTKFSDYKLEDGTIVRTDTEAIQKGSAVMVISEAGEVPLADGKYMVEIEGSKAEITVESGYVTELMPSSSPEQEVEPVEETPMSSDDFANEARAKFDDLFKRITALEDQLKAANAQVTVANENAAKFKSDLEKVSELNKKMFSIVESIANEESDSPIQKPATKMESFKSKTSVTTTDINEFRKKYKI